MRIRLRTAISPSSTVSVPARIRSSVDLPDPFGPMSPMRSPSDTVKETFWKRGAAPKAFEMLRTLISGGNDVGSPEFSYLEIIRKHHSRGARFAADREPLGFAFAGQPRRLSPHEVLPGRLAVFEAQSQSVPALDHFPCQGKVRSVLLDLGARHLNLVVRFELHAHVFQKFLRTKKDIHRIRTTFHHQIGYGFAARGRNKLQLCNRSLEFALRGGIVLGRRLAKRGSGEESDCRKLQESLVNRGGGSHRGPSMPRMVGHPRGKSNLIVSGGVGSTLVFSLSNLRTRTGSVNVYPSFPNSVVKFDPASGRDPGPRASVSRRKNRLSGNRCRDRRHAGARHG